MHIRRSFCVVAMMAALVVLVPSQTRATPLSGAGVLPVQSDVIPQRFAATPIPVGFYFQFHFGSPRYYYGHRYRYRRYNRRRYSNRRLGRRCSYWSRRCTANWGRRGANYRGCMRYHGCR